MKRALLFVTHAAGLLIVMLLASCSEDVSQITLPLDPATSDPTTAVYYASNRSGHFEIFVLRDTLGAKVTREKTYDCWWPRISPKKNKLLYYRSPAKNKDNSYAEAALWISDSDGTNASQLIALADHNWTAQGMACWSPDAAHIVMSAYEKGTGWGIFITDSLGRNPVRVNKRTTMCIDPSYSPDGTQIVYSAYPPGISGLDVTKLEIYTVNIDGTNEQRLTTDSLRDYYPSWSPDGSEIAFQTETDSVYQNVGRWAIRAVKPDGTGLRTVIDDGLINEIPRWDVNSSHIFFQRYMLVGTGLQFRIARVARDGTGLDRLSNGPGSFDDTAPDPVVQ